MSGESDARIPVDILTGFLGSGKTTLLKRWIAGGRLAETAILVNEFADLPVDERLIAFSGGNAALIGDGCLCCSSDGSLATALTGLFDAVSAGRIPPFKRVLVETSGLADPSALGATLARDLALRVRLRLGTVVTLVDLVHGTATLDDSPEALSQLIAADRVLFSKSDRAAPGAVEALVPRIAALNPAATIVTDETEALFAGVPATFPLARPRPFLALAEEERHGGIASGVIRAEAPVSWPKLAAWLSLLLHRHGPAILRIKGVVVVEGPDGPGAVVLHAVRHIVHQPEHLPHGIAPAETALVVITRDLPIAAIARSFARHVTLGPDLAGAAAE